MENMIVVIKNVGNMGNNFNNNSRPGCAGLFNNIFYKGIKEEKLLHGMPLCRQMRRKYR